MWAIIIKDSTDTFEDDSGLYDVNLFDTMFYDKYDEARAKFNEVKGNISNVYLMKVIDKEVCI